MLLSAVLQDQINFRLFQPDTRADFNEKFSNLLLLVPLFHQLLENAVSVFLAADLSAELQKKVLQKSEIICMEN